jgi:uncharacterized protein (TIGR03000 family)
MYGVVLMAALATSSSAPDFGHGGCCGWGGGYGGHGCYGGYGYGGCFGCYGGYGAYGGWCGGYGCSGCWGGSPYMACGCGGGYGYGGYGCTGCYGCYGGYSGYGIPIPGGTTYVGPGMTSPVPPPTTTPPEETPLPKKKPMEQARAHVRIELPADAKLYVDGVLTKTGSAVRTFQTPELAPNQTYFYDMKAEIVRDGRTFAESRQVLVRRGAVANTSFTGLEQQATEAAAAAAAAQSTAQR